MYLAFDSHLHSGGSLLPFDEHDVLVLALVTERDRTRTSRRYISFAKIIHGSTLGLSILAMSLPH